MRRQLLLRDDAVALVCSRLVISSHPVVNANIHWNEFLLVSPSIFDLYFSGVLQIDFQSTYGLKLRELLFLEDKIGNDADEIEALRNHLDNCSRDEVCSVGKTKYTYAVFSGIIEKVEECPSIQLAKEDTNVIQFITGRCENCSHGSYILVYTGSISYSAIGKNV